MLLFQSHIITLLNIQISGKCMHAHFLNHENFPININNECMLLELCFIKLNLNRTNVHYSLNISTKFSKE